MEKAFGVIKMKRGEWWMNELRTLLKVEEVKVQRILNQVQERLDNAPEGSLQLSKSNNVVQFYIYNSQDRKRSYISKNNDELICQLAQKSYDEKVLKSAQERLELVKKVNDHYERDELGQIYLNEHCERRKKICPVEIPWEQQLEKWIAMEYEGKEFQEGVPIIVTEKGERVRSKSEKILADYFFKEGIPYKYEKPLYLRGLGIVYPDFTFLSPMTGKEIYWEHDGRMDDPVYAENAIRKIQAYEYNNIYPGERLILTFETAKTVLDVGVVRRLAEEFLLVGDMARKKL